MTKVIPRNSLAVFLTVPIDDKERERIAKERHEQIAETARRIVNLRMEEMGDKYVGGPILTAHFSKRKKFMEEIEKQGSDKDDS